MRGHRVAGLAGDNLALASVEVRVPLTSPMGLGQAGVNLFFDTGAVYDVGQTLRKTRFRQGAGVGLFLLATVLQLNLDVASDFEGTLRAHFTTGFRF